MKSQPSSESPRVGHFERIGVVARWQPVHLGHAAVLEAMCDRSARVSIGIGSANRHDIRNPFSLTERMYDNYSLLPIPDLDDGPRWRNMLIQQLGELDVFVTANPYVAGLMANDYRILKPVHLLPNEKKVPINGSMVRRAMARNEDWQALVPPEVAEYLVSHGLDERFRRQFGLQTLALDTMIGRE
jgi:nicotinamide-nucleotide adenylyltransferase